MKQNLKHISFYFLLPLFLLIFALINLFNYLKASEFGVLNLDVRGNLDQLISTRSGELMKGDIVFGKFHSQYPNLGIVSVRFYNQDRDSDDTLVFRLKEEGKEKWYYEAKYKTDQFMPHKHFPFGFSEIKDSVGKNYEFQIESLRGASGSGILIDNQYPVFLAKSTFLKADLSGNKNTLLYFLGNKFINILGDKDLLFNNFLFFLPLIYFVIFVLSKGISFQFLTGFAMAIVIYDIFWLKGSYDSLFIGILFLWGLISRRFHFESRIAAVFALGFLALTPIMLIFSQDDLAEKTAVWAYLFLCVTVVQQIYELKKHPKNLFTLEKFKNNIFKIKFDKSDPIAQFIYRIYNPIILLLSFYILFKFGQRIYESSRLYQLFFPKVYLIKFLTYTFLPQILFLFALVITFLKVNKKFKNKIFLGFIFSLILLFSSTIIVNLSTKFRDTPTIVSVSPNDFSEAWVDIIINGVNFQDLPFAGKVLVGGAEQRIIDWKDERIIFRTDPYKLKSGVLEVITSENIKSNQYQFNYLYK
ncbi:TPA: hypothetical protein DIU22_03900 [Candidatus Woesebacteria bacterium]|nr:hypothetical protein [Candidatus Woesebacteria bacterium]